jgi:hypothetical protein
MRGAIAAKNHSALLRVTQSSTEHIQSLLRSLPQGATNRFVPNERSKIRFTAHEKTVANGAFLVDARLT